MPLSYDAYCREQESELNRRPICDECGEYIQDEYMYNINGLTYCPECIESHKSYINNGDL